MTFPAWFEPLAELPARGAAGELASGALSRNRPPAGSVPRRSAVLMLFADGGANTGPDVLLTARATSLRSHAGQVCFPGGGIDPLDVGPEAAAVREAVEETGLDSRGIEVVGVLPDLYLPPSGWTVTPVLAWWHTPSAVGVVDSAEVAQVVRVPVSALVDPANRFRVSHPSGYVGPGFLVGGLFVWGFTATLLSEVLTLAGWELPWDSSRLEPVPDLAR